MAFRRSRKTYDEPALYDYAIGALGRHMRSVAELKRLLRQRVAGQEKGEALIEVVVERLKEQKYLSDARFAEAYSSYRKENEKFGRRRVVTDLKAKGVHGAVIEKAVASAYAGVSEEKLAREHLRRKRMARPRTQKDAARIFRALARAGFSNSVIFKILKKWDVDEEVLSALESEAAETPVAPDSE